MCGFLGITSSKKINYQNFNLALQTILHRGPDNTSIWVKNDSKIIFGHNRLSIIDLSLHGNQPMSYLGRYKIIFNGEIYNFKKIRKILENYGYKFKSNTDTEIILAAYDKWRENCLEYFRGMFSFAIFDEKKNNLFMARDRVGEKPLFYIKKNNELIFSSEVKSLLALDLIAPKINLDTFDYLLTRGFTKNDNTSFENILKLPAAHFLNYNISNDTIIIKKYWSLKTNYYTDSKNINKINKIEEFDFIFKEVISQQLNSDVKTGVLLSGGIDSSLVSGLASQQKDIKTYNVSFPLNSQYDESTYAKQISNYFNTDHYQIDIKKIEPTIIDELINIYDEPLFDSSAIPTFLIFKEIKKNCKVVLGGDGGDEIFGGYRHYNYIFYLEVLQKFIPEIFRKIIKNIILSKKTYNFKGINWIDNFDLNLQINLPIIPKYFDIKEKIQIFNNKKEAYFNYKNSLRDKNINNIVKSLMYENFKNYLCDNLLVKTDMASMYNSVELRSPFLDHKLIEFVFHNLNISEKVKLFNRKIFIKKYASRYFPKNYNYKRKQGFSIPLSEWLKEDKWQQYFYDNILSSTNIFNKKYAIKLINNQNKGYDNTNKLYAILILILWFKKNKLSF